MSQTEREKWQEQLSQERLSSVEKMMARLGWEIAYVDKNEIRMESNKMVILIRSPEAVTIGVQPLL